MSRLAIASAIVALAISVGGVAHAEEDKLLLQAGASIREDHDGTSGGMVDLLFGAFGLRVALDLGYGQYDDHSSGSTSDALVLDANFKLSPIGFSRTLDYGRWFDAGIEAGFGLGASTDGGFVQGWYGGWAELALWSGDNYPSLTFEVRQNGVVGYDTDTQFLFGIAFSTRTSLGFPGG
jgi:hypothetical protein